MGDVRDIKDAAWAAYCKAPTCRDMGRSKVDAAVDSVLAISARAAVPEVRIPVPNDLIEQASRHACTVQGVNPDAKVLHGSDERQWQRLSGTVHAALHYYATTIRNARPVAAAPQPAGEESFQRRVAPWMAECFGHAISSDVRERGDRLLEEVLELLQSHGYDPGRVATLRDYVFARPVGEPSQEVGGVMVTLAAYCLATGIDMHAAGEIELARVWTKVDVIRAKQASKRDIHSPLPSASPAPSQPAGEVGPRHDHLVPGVMRCAKCAFQLHRVTLYVRSGTTGAGDSDTEPCPNGCGPLWPVTWRQWAEEAQEYAQRLQGELDALKSDPAPSAPAEVEALASEIAHTFDRDEDGKGWVFDSAKLAEFARRLSGAQQADPVEELPAIATDIPKPDAPAPMHDEDA